MKHFYSKMIVLNIIGLGLGLLVVKAQAETTTVQMKTAIDEVLYSVNFGQNENNKDIGIHSAYNLQNRYEVGFDKDEIRLKTSPWKGESASEMVWNATQWGYQGQLQRFKPAEVRVEGERVEYQRGEVTEWYINGREGMEQGFTIHQRPTVGEAQTSGLLEVRMELSGDLTAEMSEDGQTVWLKDEQSKRVLKYGGLFAYDNEGKKLPSEMLLVDGKEITLRVNDQGAAYPITIDPKINMGDGGGEKDYFGWSVDIDGERFVVGVPGFRDGIALVFVKDANAKNGWKLEDTLVAPPQDGFKGDDWFGRSVAINGDTVAVGERGGFDASIQQGEAGSVYVFVRDPSTLPIWDLQQKLYGDKPGWGDGFGYDVDIDKDLLVAGAPGDPYAGYGDAAYLFERKNGVWAQKSHVTPPPGEIHISTFGVSVAIADQIFVVGAECQYYYLSADNYPVGPGAAYVYSPYIISNPGWTLEKKLVPNEVVVHFDPYFGEDGLSKNYGLDVDIKRTQSGGLNSDTIYTVAVGAPDNPELALPPGFLLTFEPGAVFVFERKSLFGQSWSFSWAQTQKLQASDKDANPWNKYEQFGYSVAVSPDRILVGTVGASLGPQAVDEKCGAAYVFWKKDGLWDQVAKLYDPDFIIGDRCGHDVAVYKTTGIVGIPFDNVLHSNNQWGWSQGSVLVEDLIYFQIDFPDPPDFP